MRARDKKRALALPSSAAVQAEAIPSKCKSKKAAVPFSNEERMKVHSIF